MLQGKLADLPLIDILQIFTSQNKCGNLILVRNGWEAEIKLGCGEVRSATIYYCSGQDWKICYKGEEALHHLLAWSEGQFRFEASRINNSARNIFGDWKEIVEAFLEKYREPNANLQKCVPRQKTDIPLNVQMSLELEDWRILFQANGTTDMATIAVNLRMPVAQVIVWFEEFKGKGLIEYTNPPLENIVTEHYTYQRQEILWYQKTSVTVQGQKPQTSVTVQRQRPPTGSKPEVAVLELPAPQHVMPKPKVSRNILSGIMTKIRGL
jgi:hypothetical protein